MGISEDKTSCWIVFTVQAHFLLLKMGCDLRTAYYSLKDGTPNKSCVLFGRGATIVSIQIILEGWCHIWVWPEFGFPEAHSHQPGACSSGFQGRPFFKDLRIKVESKNWHPREISSTPGPPKCYILSGDVPELKTHASPGFWLNYINASNYFRTGRFKLNSSYSVTWLLKLFIF